MQACQAGQIAAQVVHRCYDLGDLLAVAAVGQAEAAVVAADTRWLDRDAWRQVELRRVGGQPLDHQPGPLGAYPVAYDEFFS